MEHADNPMVKSNEALSKRLDWPIVFFLIGVPLVALIWTPIYLYNYGFKWQLFAFAVVYGSLTAMSITGGYHRLLSHLSYRTNNVVKFFFLLFGAGAWESSALCWCTGHRRHHRFVDTGSDPYNINYGFGFAHFGWMLLKEDPRYRGKFEGDLLKDPLIAWQHKYYIPIAIFMGFAVPTLICWLAWDAPWGGLCIAGFLRITLVQHKTFLVNSLAHTFGRQTYSDKVSARDNVLLALVTWGEGYHNFHHRFQGDYRNGVRWYHWDPTKWMIRALSAFGWTYSLKRAPQLDILHARMQQQQKLMLQRGASEDALQKLKNKVMETQERWAELKREYKNKKATMEQNSRVKLAQLRADIKRAKSDFKIAFRQWIAYYRSTTAFG